ncbi:uncharacterized protein LOC130193484 [Pseudoliparis swirei]|uniref:uncharacterized protein LOC130193484 n=1 Tax=Pseudoliparis swirei TaxID=2059687 RepID=UPI0024BE6B47|nr:uncharacterized protein LOC130193484 [Pseudoliparis swirei]
MERRQAGEEDALVEVRVEKGSPVGVRVEKGSPVGVRVEKGSPVEVRVEVGSPVGVRVEKGSPVEVRVEKGSPVGVRVEVGSPADRRGYLNCAVTLAALMGVVTSALAAAFILHLVTFTAASCNPDSGPSDAQAEFNVTCRKQTGGDEPGRYDICTVNKSANYVIYGEARSPASRQVSLVQTRGNEDRPIKTIRGGEDGEGEFVFLETVNMISGTRISVLFTSGTPTSCRFLVFKL